MGECASVGDTSDSYSDSDDSSFVCESQEQAATSLPKTRLYADLSISVSTYSKPLYLDTAADVNVMQANLRVNNSTNMTVI